MATTHHPSCHRKLTLAPVTSGRATTVFVPTN